MKKIIILFVVTMGLFGCEDNSSRNVVSSQEIKDNTKEIFELKQKAIVPILEMSKNKQFKQFILNECLKQEHGEYNVYLSKIIAEYKDNISFSEPIQELAALSARIKSLNGGIEPLLFYPRAETIEESRLNQKSSATAKLAEQTVGVNQDVYDPITNASPGYVLTFDGELIFYDNITEDFAWENDVWVIGQEETGVNMSLVGDDVFSNYFSTTGIPSRSDGQAEFGGIVQVTDLGSIEPWVAGKLEFAIICKGTSGNEVKKEFDKRKRSHFRNNKWYDYQFFIGNWTTVAFGNLMVEKWMELDGGQSASVSMTIPPAVPGGVSITVTVPSKSKDDDLGQTIVQFTDSMEQEYNLSHINIKRKHQ
ncbi:MAG: hypothetical protein K2X95_05785 [Flavobacteriaceae bacterium]|nr:hypothetical protein [Flavobacteriaceae bacterium]